MDLMYLKEWHKMATFKKKDVTFSVLFSDFYNKNVYEKIQKCICKPSDIYLPAKTLLSLA